MIRRMEKYGIEPVDEILERTGDIDDYRLGRGEIVD